MAGKDLSNNWSPSGKGAVDFFEDTLPDETFVVIGPSLTLTSCLKCPAEAQILSDSQRQAQQDQNASAAILRRLARVSGHECPYIDHTPRAASLPPPRPNLRGLEESNFCIALKILGPFFSTF